MPLLLTLVFLALGIACLTVSLHVMWGQINRGETKLILELRFSKLEPAH